LTRLSALRVSAVAAALGLLLAGTAVAGPALQPALEIENQSRGTTVVLALPAGGAFALTAWHSIYDQPVTEEYRVRPGRIVEEALTSPSAAVREYFGLTGPGERQPVHRDLPALVVRVAMGRPQQLAVAGRTTSLADLGAPGDRLVLRPLLLPPPSAP
jgi:hypothetical protein